MTLNLGEFKRCELNLLEFNGEFKPHNKPLKKGLSHNDKKCIENSKNAKIKR